MFERKYQRNFEKRRQSNEDRTFDTCQLLHEYYQDSFEIQEDHHLANQRIKRSFQLGIVNYEAEKRK